jgi:HSP20 family protein
VCDGFWRRTLFRLIFILILELLAIQAPFSGEKKAESTKEEKDWHVEERSYGSFYRSMFLPFEPEEGAVEAHFDKGVLHLTIKKPAKAVKTTTPAR